MFGEGNLFLASILFDLLKVGLYMFESFLESKVLVVECSYYVWLLRCMFGMSLGDLFVRVDGKPLLLQRVVVLNVIALFFQQSIWYTNFYKDSVIGKYMFSVKVWTPDERAYRESLKETTPQQRYVSGEKMVGGLVDYYKEGNNGFVEYANGNGWNAKDLMREVMESKYDSVDGMAELRVRVRKETGLGSEVEESWAIQQTKLAFEKMREQGPRRTVRKKKGFLRRTLDRILHR